MAQFRDHKKFKTQVLNLFQLFLNKEINLTKLINELRLIENVLKNNKDTKEGIWFKFYKGYNLATTITDLELNLDSFFIESIKIAINNPIEFKIHFS